MILEEGSCFMSQLGQEAFLYGVCMFVSTWVPHGSLILVCFQKVMQIR